MSDALEMLIRREDYNRLARLREIANELKRLELVKHNSLEKLLHEYRQAKAANRRMADWAHAVEGDYDEAGQDIKLLKGEALVIMRGLADE
ncbi:MAG: hypothetical protein EBR82_30615 [Caulobacteraceae bacterium]|nr:hypothetical protein [Caulobacteraceae bacterium]